MSGGAKIKEFFLDLVFPKYCLSCGQEGDYWCSVCQTKSIKKWDGRLDLVDIKYFNKVICLADYDDEMINQLIKTCKYRFIKDLAIELGNLLVIEVKKQNLTGVIIPVPLSKKRERWRGFNQASEIARQVADETDLEYRSCLRRVKNKKAQAKLTEQERLVNMSGCFQLIGEAPKKVILVDDVITTGATVNECAKILHASGSEEILVLAVAKG